MSYDGKRSLQHVITVSDRVKCVEWMAATAALDGEKGLPAKAIDAFPAYFRSDDRRVNLNKARDWWRKRHALVDPDGERQRKFARSGAGTRYQFVMKTVAGRDPKLGEHWAWLYPLLLSEFDRLRKAGVKMSSRLVLDIAVTLIEDSVHPVYNKVFQFNGKTSANLVTPRRIQDFTDRHDIVYRRLKGEKQVSSEKQRAIHASVAEHLGRLKRQFDDGLIDPNLQYNMDESHFVIDLDDGKTLDFRGASHVKYRSVVSGREGITMCVLLRGGSKAQVECPMLIFKNKNTNYPIQGLPDSTPGVAYRTSPTAFINNSLLQEWLHEVRCWGPGGPFVKERTLWMDNASGHSGDDSVAVAKALRTKVQFFPANATDLVQPADRFPIQRIKEHWRRLCEKRNMAAIRRDKAPGRCRTRERDSSWKQQRNASNCERDKNGLNWAKKSMVLCGLDVGPCGYWKVNQLGRDLQDIVTEFQDEFKKGYVKAGQLAQL